ncbi:Fic family protein [Chloroflexota bacterium]
MPEWKPHFDMKMDDTHPEILKLVANIHAYSRVIRSIPIPPGVQAHLDALNIMRAVRGTTGIEGAELSEQEVLEILGSPRRERVLPQSRRRDEQEARNADLLMRYIAQNLVRNPDIDLSENLIRRMHQILTRGIDYSKNIPGEYRTHPVVAGSYIPPRDGENVRKLMTEFIDWYNNGSPENWDLAIKAIVAHFYVVSIHPFGDGNGRVSRGVESFVLYKAGINARGFYSLANYYYRYRAEYVEMLNRVRFETDGDLTPFVYFALKGLSEELEIVHQEVLGQISLIAYKDYARETLELNNKLGTPSGQRMFYFLLQLVEPVSIKELKSGKHKLSGFYEDLSPKTLSRDLNFFQKHKLVIVDGDKLLPNISAMTRFIPPIIKDR